MKKFLSLLETSNSILEELPMSDAIIAATARLLAGGRVFSDDPHFKELKNIKLTWVG